MTRQPRPRPRAKLLRSLYLWHRYIGLAAAAFVIVLSVTGLLLNHTEELGLDSIRVTSPAVLDWYGVRAPDELLAYRAGTLTVIEAGERIYLTQGELPDARGPLHGAVEYDGLVIVAMADQLWLLTPDGELVERLDATAGVPPDLLAIGRTGDGALAVRTVAGSFRADADLLAWTATDAHGIDWATSIPPTAAQARAVERAWRGEGLPLERVMLDLHSGRILGNAGVYLMDGAALLFLVLAASGVWLWIKRRISARDHRRKLHQD
jgi:hypothetical protein